MFKSVSRSMVPWLVALAIACLAVGLMWFFQHRFESKLMAGELDPQAAMQALAQLQLGLFVLVGLVALALSTTLWLLSGKVVSAQRWPPSGDWPAPRVLDQREALLFQRRMRFAAVASGAVAAAAIAAALL